MTPLLAIARNAFVEMVRQPVYGGIILLTIVVLVLLVPLSGWTMGGETAEYHKTDQQFLVNVAVSTLLVSGLFIAAFGAAGVVSREIADRTILTVVAKPLPRAMVIVGKFLGVAAAVTLAYWLCSMALLMVVRQGVMPTVRDKVDVPVIVLGCGALGGALLAATFCNYFFGWHFTSSAVTFASILLTAAMGVVAFVGKNWRVVSFGHEIPFNLPPALLLMLLSDLIFAALAVAASTRLGAALTLTTCAVFLWAGVRGEAFLAAAVGSSGGLLRAVPNLKYFYLFDALVRQDTISLSYVLLGVLYALCLIAGILATGVALFQTRELEDTASGAPLGVSVMALAGRVGAVALVVLAAGAFLSDAGTGAIIRGAALLAAAPVAWLFSGWFGRGVKWTWYLVLAGAVAGVAVATAGLLGAGPVRAYSAAAIVADLTVAALFVLILLLPKTRHHFSSIHSSAPSAPPDRAAAAR